MQQQRERLSYGRLVSRASFYRDKSLDLEKRVVFAEEQIQTLEEQILQLEAENVTSKEREKHFEQLKKDYEALQGKAATTEESESLTDQLAEKGKKIDTLNETIAELNRRSEGGGEGGEKIAQFERLLAEVQTELNEKEQQLDVYQARIKSLEKRLSSQNYTPANRVIPPTEGLSIAGKKVIAFFDYSLIIGEKETIIRGNLHVENIGRESLGTPFVCFRFYPIDASTLKGKIISIEQAERGVSSSPGWVYMEDEWGQTAKDRGEIWIRPFQQARVNVGDHVTVEDFQIPVKKQYHEKVIVEGFVYFQNDEYKQKAANQILITF